MGDSVVELVGVSKCYRVSTRARSATLRDAVAGWVRERVPRGRGGSEVLWALDGIDTSIAGGTSVGVIGRNGAGKSTLLKVLTRITQPTLGVCRTRGRVGSLLEVGTGFHPELTGRENVFLNGAILGMSRRVTAARFDEIIGFAGVERFIDTPVKRYSSGMYLRLAFAVAAHLDAEILVVDEVLAVGDAEFQRKCLATMGDIGRNGRTVVFVSHDLDAVRRLCARALWLDRGRVVEDGLTEHVLRSYLSAVTATGAAAQFERSGSSPVHLAAVRVLDAAWQERRVFMLDEPVRIELTVVVAHPQDGLDASVILSTPQGTCVLDEAASDVGMRLPGAAGTYRVVATIPPVLNAGEFVVGAWLGTHHEDIAFVEGAVRFEVEGGDPFRRGRLLNVGLPWAVEPAWPG